MKSFKTIAAENKILERDISESLPPSKHSKINRGVARISNKSLKTS